jgi:hypothetical protein
MMEEHHYLSILFQKTEVHYSSQSVIISSSLVQVSDFGLAKIQNVDDSHVSTRVMGTFG